MEEIYSYNPNFNYPFDSINSLLTTENILYRTPNILETAYLSLEPYNIIGKRFNSRYNVYNNRNINYDGIF